MTRYFVDDNGIARVVTRRSQDGGAAVHPAKLDAEKARLIRIRYGEGNISQIKLAKEYGVSVLTIGNIIRGVTYKEEI